MNLQLDIPAVFFLIILLSLFTLIVYQLIEWLENRVVFWTSL